MKKLLLLGFISLLLISCQNQPQRYFEESPEINTVKAVITAYEKGDWDAWKSNFAEDAELYHNTSDASTLDEIMVDMKQTLSHIEYYAFGEVDQVIEMVIDKDGKTWVNYWGHWKGVTKVTNKRITFPVHLTVEFLNGKIVKEFAYYDTSVLKTALAEIAEAKATEI